MYLPPPFGSLSRALVFQYEEAKLSPPSPKCCLHIKNTAAFSAVCLWIWFISYPTEASSLFRTWCTQLWGERCGGEGLERALLVFSANLEDCWSWSFGWTEPEVFGRNLNSLACLELWSCPSLHHSWHSWVTSREVGNGMWGLNHLCMWACVQLESTRTSTLLKWVEQGFA